MVQQKQNMLPLSVQGCSTHLRLCVLYPLTLALNVDLLGFWKRTKIFFYLFQNDWNTSYDNSTKFSLVGKETQAYLWSYYGEKDLMAYPEQTHLSNLVTTNIPVDTKTLELLQTMLHSESAKTSDVWNTGAAH